MASVPAGRDEVEIEALPLVTTWLAIVEPPTANVTVPDETVVPEAVITFAVSITLCPDAMFRDEGISVVVVAMGATDTEAVPIEDA